MSALAPARRVALALLSQRRRRGARMRELLRTSRAMGALDARDRALASRLALATVASEGLLDELVDACLRRPSAVEPRVRDALRLATFELCFLDTPVSVGVSQGVELVRSVQPHAAGMANAVLRRVADEARGRVAAARGRCEGGGATLDDLALSSGLPRWLLSRIAGSCGTPAARDVARSQLEAAPVYVASNLVRRPPDEAEALLRAAGLSPVATSLPASFRLEAPAGLATSGLVASAEVVVADLAAQLVACVAAPRPGTRMLEVGQGRGTKTILLESAARGLGGLAEVVGVDSAAHKVDVASRRMARAGLSGAVSCLALDARSLFGEGVAPRLARPFDTVLVDAPCSGTGTMRRHPETCWSLDERSLSQGGPLPGLQLQILSAAAARVARGGTLVYATCSLIHEENEGVVEAFLRSAAGEGFSLARVMDAPGVVALPDSARDLVAGSLGDRGLLQTLPRPGSYDGHFCARLVRA